MRGPGASKRADGGFRGAVDAESFHPDRGDNRGIQDNRSPILQQRKRFLHGEKQPFDVDIEDLVEMLLCNSAQRGKTSDSRVGENDIEVPFLFLDGSVKQVQFRQVRYIALNAKHTRAETFYGRVKFSLTPAGDNDFGSFAENALGGVEADSGGST